MRPILPKAQPDPLTLNSFDSRIERQQSFMACSNRVDGVELSFRVEVLRPNNLLLARQLTDPVFRRFVESTMDPLSLTASIITVASLAASTCRAFHDLRTACKTLPGRLHALSNEVTDLELVLHQVASLVQERAQDPTFPDQQAYIPQLLKQAQAKLEELRSILRKITNICAKTTGPLFRVHAWRKDQPKLQVLQEDIRSVKCSLNILLGASNS